MEITCRTKIKWLGLYYIDITPVYTITNHKLGPSVLKTTKLKLYHILIFILKLLKNYNLVSFISAPISNQNFRTSEYTRTELVQLKTINN